MIAACAALMLSQQQIVARSSPAVGASPTPTPTPTPAPTIHGKFSSLTNDKHGTTLAISMGTGSRFFRLTADAKAQQRSTASTWVDTPLTWLKPGEPVNVTINQGGYATLIQSASVPVATRLIIVQDGYVVTTSGIAYKLVGDAAAEAAGLPLGIYLVLRTDPDTNEVYDLVASRVPLTAEGTAVRNVTVTFVVQVPVNTPGTDTIYMATDRTNWTPNAIRMSPLPGNKWTATVTVPGGTVIAYKYTRGSWPTDERNAAGSEISNRALTVTTSHELQTVTDAVARWADLSS